MKTARAFRLLLVCAALTALGVSAYWFRSSWLGWFSEPVPGTTPTADHHDHDHGPKDRIKLTAQAQANLRLVAKPIKLETYQRSIQLPGLVVERRGKGDQSIVAPVTGVVKELFALPGDTVQPGGPILSLRINSEPLQTSQTELYKAVQEIKIAQDQKARLEPLVKSGAASEVLLREALNQIERFSAIKRAYKADLAVKGLKLEQIEQAENGDFLKEIVVFTPLQKAASEAEQKPVGNSEKQRVPLLEMEDLKVHIGEQVQAGQLLASISNHLDLFVEGRGFREDTPLLEQTAANDWSLQATFVEELEGNWPPMKKPLTILYLANNIDTTSQTFPFYVPLANQYREYNREGKIYRIWRYRPGQRVQLNVPVQEFKDVFVLPVSAVVREGADAYVFRQNDVYFDRKSVHVIYEDSRRVVIANDGSIFAGNHIAQNAADAINRALKAQSEGGKTDPHAGHNH